MQLVKLFTSLVSSLGILALSLALGVVSNHTTNPPPPPTILPPETTPPVLMSSSPASSFDNIVLASPLSSDALAAPSTYPGCTVMASHPIFDASKSGNRKELLRLLSANVEVVNYCDNAWQTPIFHTALNTDIANTLLLSSYGADIDHQDAMGNTPLMYSIARDNLTMVKNLLELQARTDIPNINLDIASHQALRYASNDIFMELLRYNAPSNIPNAKGEYPIHIAARRGNLDGISYLVQIGASLESRDNFGRTPLMFASAADRLDAVKHLLSLGARIDATSTTCDTPLSVAKNSGSSNVIAYLTNLGAPDKMILTSGSVCSPSISGSSVPKLVVDGVGGVGGVGGVDGVDGADVIDGIGGVDGADVIDVIDVIDGADVVDGVDVIDGADSNAPMAETPTTTNISTIPNN